MATETKGSTKAMKWIIICFMTVVLAFGVISGIGAIGGNSGSQDTEQSESGSSEPSPF